MLLLLLTFGAVLNINNAAEPLHMPPLKDYYEFDFDIKWQMTSAPVQPDRTILLANFDVDKQKWFLRSNVQLLPCDIVMEAGNMENSNGFIQLDGLHRRVTSINGISPGPHIVVPFGAEVAVRVHNHLITEGLTLHMHGLDNKWYMDGVGNVQQCPIGVGTTYTYRFIADVPGTLWYHGHLGVDRGDGLLGALIIIKPDEAVRTTDGRNVLPDKQFVMMLQDWHNDNQKDGWLNLDESTMKFSYGNENFKKCWRSKKTHDGTNIGGSAPLNALLINDKGWYNQTDVQTRPWALPLERFRVNPGDNVLFRIINGGLSFQMVLSIEDHKFQVVAADGPSIQPVETDFLQIFPGERYDILVPTMTNPARKEYYIIVETAEMYDLGFVPVKPQYTAAVLEYNSFEPNIPNRVPDWQHTSKCMPSQRCTVVNCPYPNYPKQYNYNCIMASQLKSLEPPKDPGVVATNFPKGDFQEFFINAHFDSHMNGWRFEPPKAPPYFSPEDETKVAKPCNPDKCPHIAPLRSKDCYCFYHLNITLGVVAQLNLYNLGAGSGADAGFHHPFHLHGYHYYVMKSGYGTYNQDTGVLTAGNKAFDCGSNPVNGRCNNVSFTDQAWTNGHVPEMNTVNPSFRDTVVVPAGGYTIVRIRANNPGWFYAHCHLMLHHMLGMAFAVRVGDRDQMPKPPSDFPSNCGNFDPPRIRPPK